MNELSSTGYVEECLLVESQSASVSLEQHRFNSSNFSNNSSQGLFPLPPLEQSFLQPTKEREFGQDTKLKMDFLSTNNFNKTANNQPMNINKENESFLSERNQLVNAHPYSQSSGYSQQLLSCISDVKNPANSGYSDYELPQCNESSYEYMAAQINIFHSTGFYHDHQIFQDAVNSKSSLSSLKSLASSISAVPILDPELFNLNKERKFGNKSSKFCKAMKNTHGKRRKPKFVSRESESAKCSVDEKEFSSLSNKQKIIKAEVVTSRIDNERHVKTEQRSHGFSSEKKDKNQSYFCHNPSSNDVSTNVAFIQPTVTIHQRTKNNNAWKNEAAVYTDLTKIKAISSKRKLMFCVKK